MELLNEKSLVTESARLVSAENALAEAKVVAFYFSAHWSPPCRNFSPLLRNCYKQFRKDNVPVEVVFVSRDPTESEMFEFMHESHGDWFALPFGDPVNKLLMAKYNVTEIPRLVVVNAVSGDTIHSDARSCVETEGTEYFKQCVQQALSFVPKSVVVPASVFAP